MHCYLLMVFMWVGLSLAQETQVLELELLIEADPEILFNHVNPVLLSLNNSYGDFIVEATGQLYQDDPEIYWQTLEPVVWKLELPNNLDALDVKITARLALCDKQQGLCYFEDVDLQESLDITAETKKTLTLTLRRPDY